MTQASSNNIRMRGIMTMMMMMIMMIGRDDNDTCLIQFPTFIRTVIQNS